MSRCCYYISSNRTRSPIALIPTHSFPGTQVFRVIRPPAHSTPIQTDSSSRPSTEQPRSPTTPKMSLPHPDPTSLLPQIYQSHPSRPLPHTPTTTARTGVIVVFPSPITPSDERKISNLQDVRKTWDQAYARWLPHVTLLPPFPIPSQTARSTTNNADGPSKAEKNPTNQAESLLQAESTIRHDPSIHPSISEQSIHALLSTVCATISPHTLRLSETGTFPLRAYTNVHLRPSPNEQGTRDFLALQGSLQRGMDALVPPADERLKNRAERRRVAQADRTPRPVPPPPVVPSSDTPSPDVSARPMVRHKVVDEARCVTLSTTEITLDRETTTDHVSAATEAESGRETTSIPSSDQRDQPSQHPSSRSSAPRARPHRSFKPHLSIGQARGPIERERLVSLANGIIKGDTAGQVSSGIQGRIDSVFFLSKPVGAPGPYEVVSVVPLLSEDT